MISSVKINKEEVKNSFNKASLTYKEFALLQKEVANKLIKEIDKNTFKNILDVGCGTGFVTEELKLKFPYSNLFAIDIAYNMARETKNRTNTNVLTSDMEEMPFKNNSFDLITSSLCYQWANTLDKSFSEAIRVLNKDGVFHFTTFTEGTLKELNSSINNSLNKNNLNREEMTFAKEEEIIEILKRADFKNIKVKKEKITTFHKDIFYLLNSLKKIGATGPARIKNNNLSSASLLKKANQYYKENFTENNKIKASYEVVFVKARK